MPHALSRARAALAACCAIAAVLATTSAARAAEPAFPRTLGLYLQHDALPSAATIARYDVVVIDNEWAHRSPALLAEVRRLNPSITLLAYVNLVDRNLSLGDPAGWSNRRSLWGYTSANTLGTFPEAWIAKKADGTTISEWSGTWMSNLSDTAPLVGGQRYYQYAANWVVDNVWASGAWDGIFLDVWGDRIWNSAASNWDVNRDGADDSGAALYGPGSPWERGITGAEQIMRARMGSGAVLVANNTRTFRTQQIDGRDWESFADPGKGRTFAADVPNYVAGVLDPGHKQPGVQLALDKDFTGTGTATDRQRARYFMTAALLSNGYWGGSVGDYGGFGWYEEMDGAGRGRGYLGQPAAAAPTWAQISAAYSTSAGVGRYASGVYRRDFANGISLVNPSGAAQTVTLEAPFTRLSGSAAPNTGGSVQTLTIPAQDGIILLRGAGTPAAPPANPAPAAVGVSVAPAAASVATGDARAFAAIVTDGTGVTWSVNGVAGGNAAAGRITTSGVYTAPAAVPSGAVTVRATHSSGAYAQAAVTVTARVTAPVGTIPPPAATPPSPGPVAAPSPAPSSPAPSPKSRASAPLLSDGFEGGALAGPGSAWSAVRVNPGATAAVVPGAGRSGAAARFADTSATARSAFVRRSLAAAATLRVRADLRVARVTLGRHRTRALLSVSDARGGAVQAGLVRERSGALRWAVWSVDRAGRRGAVAAGAALRPGAWSTVELRTSWNRARAVPVLSVGDRVVAAGAPLDLRGRRAAAVDVGLVSADSPADDAVLYVDAVAVSG